jgi:8-oxo-dGTP diphosphatase
MRLIAEIREQDVVASAPVVDSSNFRQRHAVRAVVLNDAGAVALLYTAKRGYHKLPGGGIEDGESKADALGREVMEEIGCKIVVDAEVGRILEYKDEKRQMQTSDCFLAYIKGEQGDTNFTDEEQEHGFVVMWAKNIDMAIALLEADEPLVHAGLHIRPRDLLFLKTAKQILQ